MKTIYITLIIIVAYIALSFAYSFSLFEDGAIMIALTTKDSYAVYGRSRTSKYSEKVPWAYSELVNKILFYPSGLLYFSRRMDKIDRGDTKIAKLVEYMNVNKYSVVVANWPSLDGMMGWK